MSENKDIQGKSTQVAGLKKSVHKSVLKDGEYHHLKNGTISSFEGDIPFIQNMPSNLECVNLKNLAASATEMNLYSFLVLQSNAHIAFTLLGINPFCIA